MLTSHWTLAILVGVPLLSFIAIALTVGGVIFWRKTSKDDDRSLARLLVVIVLVFFALPATVGAVTIPFPYKAEYNQWRPIDGTISDVSSGVFDGGRTTYRLFTVTFDGSERQYILSDNRAALVKKGDQITLMCHPEWRYASAPSWTCNWGSNHLNTAEGLSR